LHLLHELAFRADREQDLDQRGAQQPFGRNRGAAIGGIKLGEFRIERGQRRIHELADFAKRMMGGNTVFHIDVAEHRTRLPILSAHKNLLRHARRESYSLCAVSSRVFQQPARSGLPAPAPCTFFTRFLESTPLAARSEA